MGKLLKALTSLTLIMAMFTLHIEHKAIAFSSAYSVEEENESEESPTFNVSETADPSKPHLDYRNSEQKIGKLSKAQMMTTLAMLLGPSIAMACFQPISSKIFAAAGAIYLVMEVMNYGSYKKASTSNQEMYASLDPDTADKQIEAFRYAEEQERTAAKALGKKASAINIFAMGMTAAAAMALVEGIRALIPSQQGSDVCTGAVSSIESAPLPYAQIYLKPIQRESFADYDARINEYSSFVFESDKYQSPVPVHYEDSTQYFATNFKQEEQNTLKDMLYLAMNNVANFIVPTAQAKEAEKVKGPLGTMGILSAAAGAILAYKGVAKGVLQKALKNGFVRAAVFGVFAGLGFMAKGEVNKAKGRAEANADVYKNLREQLERALNGAQRFAGINGSPTAVRNRLAGYQGIRDAMDQLPQGALCLVGSAGEKRIDEQCKCAKTNSCAKADFNTVGLQGQGLPPSFGSSLDSLGRGANSLFSGNTAAANSAFGSLGQNAANLRNLRDQLKKKADAEFKKANSKATMAALEAEAEKQLEELAPRVLNGLSPNGRSLAGIINGNGALNSSGVTADTLQKAKEGKTDEVLASIQAGVAAKKETSPLADFKFDLSNGENSEIAAADISRESLNTEQLGDFITDESDISDRPNENIFKIITVRYFKSAYPRFFNEEAKSLE